MEAEIFVCKQCDAEFHENEADYHETFPGNLEEPSESVFKCPTCGAIDDGQNTIITIEYRVLCQSCEEVQVQHDGEYCAECRQVELERHWDELTGH